MKLSRGCSRITQAHGVLCRTWAVGLAGPKNRGRPAAYAIPDLSQLRVDLGALAKANSATSNQCERVTRREVRSLFATSWLTVNRLQARRAALGDLCRLRDLLEDGHARADARGLEALIRCAATG